MVNSWSCGNPPFCASDILGIGKEVRKRCVGWLFLLGVSKTKYRTDKMIEGLRSHESWGQVH